MKTVKTCKSQTDIHINYFLRILRSPLINSTTSNKIEVCNKLTKSIECAFLFYDDYICLTKPKL